MLYVTVMDILSVQFELSSVSVMFPPFNVIVRTCRDFGNVWAFNEYSVKLFIYAY